jgi:cation diffusion facilitator family transporter
MSDHDEHGTGHIIQSLLVNVLIAVSKLVAAVITASGAMLAETLHSFADCGNQLLLLVGVRQARKPPDPRYPLGQGRAVYFWSFMVALLLFAGGGMFSIYEGVHKFRHAEPEGDITVGVIVLGISLLLEGYSMISNIVELNKRRGKVGFFRYLKQSKDSDLIVVFGENSAAVLGLIFALSAVVLAKQTGDGRWDSVGSILIGVVLVGVAVFLAKEVKSLLVGESADPAVDAIIAQCAVDDPMIDGVLRILTMQQGPNEVVLAMKVRVKAGLQSGGEIEEALNAFERRIEAAVPEVKWLFIEPDVRDD